MGSESHKVIRGFLSEDERRQLLDWVESLEHPEGDANEHMSNLSRTLKGKAFIFDQSQTELTRYITKFQSINEVSTDKPAQIVLDVQSRISKELGLPTDNVFVQAVDMQAGGNVGPHYDASLKGHINYKCNVSILSEDYSFFIDKQELVIGEGDLYAFEASLYRHHTNEFKSRRVFLSFGFVVPYSATGRSESDPRVRLGQRIERYFQSNV